MMVSFVLAVVQGLSEFLPVSSSGHLVILGHLLREDMTATLAKGPLFEIVVHLGTLLSVLFFLRHDLVRIACQLCGVQGADGRRIGGRLVVCVAVATVPVGFVGLVFKSSIEGLFMSPQPAALMLVVTGLILLTTRRCTRENPTLFVHTITLKKAILIGLAQAVAILPGISRSGMTISAALFLGMQREEAARFSFLLSIPAILGAAVVQFGGCASAEIMTVELGLSFLVSFICGLFALYLLRAVLRLKRFYVFAYYVIPVGLIAFFVSWLYR